VAAAAATLLTAALTMGASPVHAAESTVEFRGGSTLNLLCKSEPSNSKASVSTGGRISFVNRLGQTATLTVDGKAVKSVGPNQAVPVVFQYGPVSVAMTFSCGVGVAEQFRPVSVTVTAAPAAAGATSSRAGTAQGATAGVAPRTSPTSGERASRGSGTSATQQEPGTEPADPSLLGPEATAEPGPALTEPPAGSGTKDRVHVEQPVAASGPAHNGPAGLLALVAAVCVVGVGMAAIRAIIAQRSSRTSFA
jgi:hypothetical protein